jgi:hypothetical protein
MNTAFITGANVGQDELRAQACRRISRAATNRSIPS